MKPTIYIYDDFKKYLEEWLEWRKSCGPYSMRAFAREGGFSSPNILQQVMAGKKRLAGVGILKFANALALDDQEIQFFENLVAFGQASNPTERLRFYHRIVSHPRRKTMAPLEAAKLTFFREWLAPVIYEMVDFPDFEFNAEWVAAQFTEPPRLPDIRKALADLEAIGVIEVDGDGAWKKRDADVTSGDNIRDVHLFAYHETALEKTADALVTVPMNERSFNVITASIPKSAYEGLRLKFEAIEKELLSLIDNAPEPRDEVVQIGWYLFPSVRRRRRKGQ